MPKEKRLVGEIDRFKRNRKLLLDYNKERENLAKLEKSKKLLDKREKSGSKMQEIPNHRRIK